MSVHCWYYDNNLTLQVIVHPLPAVGIAVLLITLTCMCLGVTILITMSQEVQRMKIIRCSGSFGGTTLLRAAGSRFGQMVICPQSWRLCQVKHCIPFLARLSNCLVLICHFEVEFVLGFFFPAVLHGNNLLVFGGTGIPFGENNGNDVHVCNVKYKRWSLLNCRGKKPNRIYGQVSC